jgi:predicted phosphodiesterase
MPRYAIISDIHGNLHAFQAVLRHMAHVDVSACICLGDVVGYGPYPGACIDLVVKHCSITVQGNHDEAVVDPYCAERFNGAARTAVYWTRDVLGPLHLNALLSLKPSAGIGDLVMCTHASPFPGPTDYVHDKQVAALAFRGVDRPICLVGHTHVPMVFETPSLDPNDPLTAPELVAYLPQDQVEIKLERDHRYICNPGAVGQPRDCDPRASYAVLDTDAMTFTVHRVEYDIAGAQAATQEVGLPPVLADRLAIGA